MFWLNHILSKTNLSSWYVYKDDKGLPTVYDITAECDDVLILNAATNVTLQEEMVRGVQEGWLDICNA